MKNTIFLIDKDSAVNDYNEHLLKGKIDCNSEIIKINEPIQAINFFIDQKKIENQDTTIHLFLGLHFPDMCGFEFMETIEELDLDSHYDFRVYLLTADNSAYVHEKIHVFPMVQQHIQKPLTLEKIKIVEMAA